MNSRQRRKRKRFSERMFKSIDMSRIMEMIWERAGRPVFKLTLDTEQPDIAERILTSRLEITRELMGSGVVED